VETEAVVQFLQPSEEEEALQLSPLEGGGARLAHAHAGGGRAAGEQGRGAAGAGGVASALDISHGDGKAAGAAQTNVYVSKVNLDVVPEKKTKKIKATNLNTATTGKEEPKKEDKKKKAEEEEGWQEEEVVQATMKVEAAGKLIREEEKVEEQDNSAPAWGNVKTKDNQSLNDKRFPTLAKSVASSAINLEDKSGQINISTSKNKFANT